MAYTEFEERFICHLQNCHTGGQKAASSKQLEAVFHVKGRELRQLVNKLRSDGCPICSDSGGYYYPASLSEVKATAAQLNSRIIKIAKARAGLMRYIKEHSEDEEV